VPDYDILIAGGGMVGATLACALAGNGARIALLEAVPPAAGGQPSYDDRGLSLSLSSIRILDAVGIWPDLGAAGTPIRHIHVSDRGHFGFVRLHASELGLDAFGCVVVAREFGRVLNQRITTLPDVDFLCPVQIGAVAVNSAHVSLDLKHEGEARRVSGRLLVAADGAHSGIASQLGIMNRVKDYGQTAIVANVTPQRHLPNTAFERFTDTGPVALLPLSEERYVMVYCVKTSERDACMELGGEAFRERLQQRFGRRLGRIIKVGARKSYPLQLVEPERQVHERIVLLGNSAHTIHPNGAQGLNLCLRDLAGLVERLIPALAAGGDPGASALLSDYLAERLPDQRRIIGFSDRLAELFGNQLPLRVAARDAGMLLTDLIPALKRDFARMAMGVGPRQPGMARSGS